MKLYGKSVCVCVQVRKCKKGIVYIFEPIKCTFESIKKNVCLFIYFRLNEAVCVCAKKPPLKHPLHLNI